MDRDKKSQVIDEYKINQSDTGSVDVQLALLTARIKELTEHLKVHRKDNHTRTGLIKLVGQRRKFLNYLSRSDAPRYRSLLGRLGLRR